MPSAAARRTLGEGIDKVARIYASCAPSLLLSTASYLRLRWLSSKLLGAGTADHLRQLLQGTVTQRSDVIRSSHQVSAEPPSLPTSPPQANVGHAEPAAGLVGLLSMPLSVSLEGPVPPRSRAAGPRAQLCRQRA